MNLQFVSNVAKNIESLSYEAYPPEISRNENTIGIENYFNSGMIKAWFFPIKGGYKVECMISADNSSDRESASEMRAERAGCPFRNIDHPMPKAKETQKSYTFYFPLEDDAKEIAMYLIHCHEQLKLSLHFK